MILAIIASVIIFAKFRMYYFFIFLLFVLLLVILNTSQNCFVNNEFSIGIMEIYFNEIPSEYVEFCHITIRGSVTTSM